MNLSNTTPLDQLLQALQGLTQPGQAQPMQQGQQQVDPNQLFQSLISGAIQNTSNGNKLDFSKYNVPMDTPHGPMMHEGQHQIESQATLQALSNGADPALLDKAKQFLGQNAYIGLCEAFVERMTQGAEGIYRSAIDAWNQHQGARKEGLSGIQPGDAVYFGADASNNGYGHTGVYMGNGKFISATDNGIKQYDLNDWQKITGQKLLGYVPEGQKNQQTRNQLYPKQPTAQKPMQIPSVSQSMPPKTSSQAPQRPPMPQQSSPLSFLGNKPQQQSPLSFLNKGIV